MDNYQEPLVDHHGRTMFYCSHCNGPISPGDILDLGTRLPDFGETAQDYLDSELLDGFEHARCIAAAKVS